MSDTFFQLLNKSLLLNVKQNEKKAKQNTETFC